MLMRNRQTPKRQFSLRFVFCVMTAAAIASAGWSFASRSLAQRAHDDKLHRAEVLRQHNEALIKWESRKSPWSFDFGE
jgi:hypothetical protein